MFGKKKDITEKIKQVVIGGPRSPLDRSVFHKLSLVAFFAWVGLGADGLSSSCYGPPEAWNTLEAPVAATQPAGGLQALAPAARAGQQHLGLFVGLATALTVIIISASYSHVVEVFPSGGGGYLVASKLLSPGAGAVAGSALLIDYVLTISVSIASGSEALLSMPFVPAHWAGYKISIAVAGVAVLTLLNLRGVKESVLPLVPIFLIFVLSHLFVIVYAVIVKSGEMPTIIAATAHEVQAATASKGGTWGMLMVILTAYSMGAGTYTGIEAVSNGLPLLREPRVQTAKRTMVYMAASLAFMAMGLMVAYVLFRLPQSATKTINAVLFDRLTEGWGTPGIIFSLVALASEAAILFVAAQTGFLGGPRVVSYMALDGWFPRRFALLSDRLVSQNGVLLMGIAALATILLTGANVTVLLVLYAINVFITFVLSQLGMVRHWWKVRATVKRWWANLTVNGLGLLLSLFILVSISAIKFDKGGWVTLLVTGSLVGLAFAIRAHYKRTNLMLGRLDELVAAAESAAGEGEGKPPPQYDPEGRTAVIMVSGFNGLGLHTTFGALRMFGDAFKNFAFVEVGAIDAGNFKGREAVDELREHVPKELDRYVRFMKRNGYYAEAFWAIGVDIIEEITQLVPVIQKRFPQAVFFGGQLVFPQETFFTRWLHNYVTFVLLRKFYQQGLPFVILPIRVAGPAGPKKTAQIPL